MKRFFLALVLPLFVATGCGSEPAPESTLLEAVRCGGVEPEGVCNAITECVWTGEETSACLQVCESTEQDCEEGETCRRRLLRTSGGRFESTFVCFPDVVSADTADARDDRTEVCAARDVDSCMRVPECDAFVATKLFVEDECRQIVPTDCLPNFGSQADSEPEPQICLPSTYYATRDDLPDDIFFFTSICSEREFGFEGFYPEFDDPLFDVLYVESSAWPRCYCSVNC
ncbi:MAG: hypothetical protein AAGF92_01445 [Myxococcota bacterium]